MWTQFWDMHSGGGQKLGWARIYIEAPMDEAQVIFYNRFGRNPRRVTCTCCGPDYSISSEESLAQLTGYHRGCDHDDSGYLEQPATKYSFNPYLSLEDYMKGEDVTFVPASHITDKDRRGSVPDQGYVWVE